MPKYQYRCADCGEERDVVQSFTDDALTVCPVCEGRFRKVFSAVGVVFKGSGFYKTDSRSSNTSSGDGSSGNGSDSSSGEKSGESSSESSGESSAKSSESSTKSDGSDSSSTSKSSDSKAKQTDAA